MAHQRKPSAKVIHDVAVNLQNPTSSKKVKEEAASILAIIPRHPQRGAKKPNR